MEMATLSSTFVMQMGIIEAARIGLEPLLTPTGVLVIVIGTLIGLVFGSLPGLGGVVALTLLLPVSLTFSDAGIAVLLFGSALGGVAFGGSVSAILINTPGTGPNAATCLDGYPMAQKGESGRALTASAVSSASGAIIGLLIFLMVIPFLRPIIFAFFSAEKLMLAIVGIVAVSYTSGRLLVGVIAGFFGIALSFTGIDIITGNVRYTFGFQYLQDGYQLVPILIGLYALTEAIQLGVTQEQIAENIEKVGGGRLQGVRDVIRSWKLLVRSSIIGFLIGVVPAAGGVTANFIAYAQAAQFSDDPESFGTGRVEGVIAAESANDAKDGGAMLPSLGLAVPGSPAWAVILGGFALHGLFPGPNLVTDNLPIIFTMFYALLVSNVLTSAIGLLTVNYLTKITVLPPGLIVSGIIVLSIVGTYATRFSMGDVYVAVVFGVIGYVMKRFDWPRIALVLGLILGPIAEQNFHTALQTSSFSPDYAVFFLRPISATLFLIVVTIIVVPVIRDRIPG